MVQLGGVLQPLHAAAVEVRSVNFLQSCFCLNIIYYICKIKPLVLSNIEIDINPLFAYTL